VKQQKADRRSQRTHRLVRSAFTELLGEKPYEEILVQDILDRANIGRTTFYAHYFDKKDVLDSITEQELSMLTHQIAHAIARQRVVPSLELFEHAYHSHNQQFLALMRSRAGEPLWEALQTALCRAIEPALFTLCAERRSPSIPVPVVSQYLAGAFLTLFKWWVEASMPYPPEQMESIFQQLALPGVRAMFKEK
jgi:AcrR family transcriptional regulator